MRQEIKIEVLDPSYDDDIMQFRINLSNEITSTSFVFYGYEDIFKEFAKSLISFPKNISDVVIYEVGENIEIWAYYMFLKVFCHEWNGNSAIQVIIDNHQKLPATNKIEFYITTVPASLNKLGHSLSNWNPLMDKEIVWIAE